MPAKRTAKKAEPAAPADSSTPAVTTAATPTSAPAAASAAASADVEPAGSGADLATPEPDAEVEQVPMNRAERRAKGKGGAAAQPTSRGKVVGGKGPASTQRMWANRRSG